MADNFTIRGVITLTAPAHQSSPERSGNHTALMTTRVITDGGFQTIPIITANSVRGVLRRLATERVAKALAAKNAQIPRDLYLSIARGAFSRTGMKAGEATIKEHIAARTNVFAGLFGGGARMFPARLRMECDLVPMVTETSELIPVRLRSLCRGSAVLRDEAGTYRGDGLTTKVLLTGRDDLATGKGGAVIENYEAAYREHVLNVADKAKGKKAQTTAIKKAKAEGTKLIIDEGDIAKADSLATFATLDVINPGVRLYFGARLNGVTQAQLGLALLAIQDWCNLNALGGGSIRGRGSFVASLSLEHNGVVLAESLLVGEPPNYSLNRGDAVTAAIGAAQAELDAETPATLGAAYPTNTELSAVGAEAA